MKNAQAWYKKFFPSGLGIEERENFIEQVKEIQKDVLNDVVKSMQHCKNEDYTVADRIEEILEDKLKKI